MEPKEIYNKLGSIVNPITDHIKDWKSVNKNSILITMDFGEEFIFTYYIKIIANYVWLIFIN